MRLDELRRKSAESADTEREALERHAPAAERDARATRDLAQAAGDLAAVPLGGFLPGGSKPVASAGGPPAAATPPGIGTEGEGRGGGGFSSGPRFLSSQPGTGRQGGRILAEEWIGEHCVRTEFEIPNPLNTNAIAEADFAKVPGWDCSSALGVPPGTVVYYDPEAWEALQGVARAGKTSTAGSVNPSASARERAAARVGKVNPFASGQYGAGGTAVRPIFGSAQSTSPSGSTSDPRALKLLSDIVKGQEATVAELRKRPAGPTGGKGQRLV